MKSFVIITSDSVRLEGNTKKVIDAMHIGHMVVYDGTVMNRTTYSAIGISEDEYFLLCLGDHNKRLLKRVEKYQSIQTIRILRESRLPYRTIPWEHRRDEWTFYKFLEQYNMLHKDEECNLF